jgi:hypothetical protein
MEIVHGTWIPDDTDDFHQRGAFCVWVETDTPLGATLPGEHPGVLTHASLASFLTEKLGVREDGPDSLARKLTTKFFVLPTANDRPVPSFEMLPYVEDEAPDELVLTAWKICCYTLPNVISSLNDFQFIAANGADGFQLGQDILFWQQHAQAMRGIILRDQYIPRLAYRELPLPKAGKGSTNKNGQRSKRPPVPAFEIQPGWEIVSATY